MECSVLNKWKLCSNIVFVVAFVLLAMSSFILVVSAYSPVELGDIPQLGIFDTSLSIEIEPLGVVLNFVFCIFLIAIGAVCRAKGSWKIDSNGDGGDKQPL
jgi:hypothetical protein